MLSYVMYDVGGHVTWVVVVQRVGCNGADNIVRQARLTVPRIEKSGAICRGKCAGIKGSYRENRATVHVWVPS